MTVKSVSKLWVKLEEPNEPVIRSVLGEVKKVHITIFNAKGQMVHESVLSGGPSGHFNGESYYDYTWNGPKAGGVYVAVVDGETAEGMLRGKTKFAVTSVR